MARYEVQHAYHSVGAQVGPWKVGDLVELDEASAEWVNRDSPGCLVAAAEAPRGEPVREQLPGRDRQHRGGRNRGGS